MVAFCLEGSLVVLLTFNLFSASDAIDCYSCENVTAINECHNVKQCSENVTECIAYSVGSGDTMTYTLGCDTQEQCHGTTVPSTISTILSTMSTMMTSIKTPTKHNSTTTGNLSSNKTTSTLPPALIPTNTTINAIITTLPATKMPTSTVISSFNTTTTNPTTSIISTTSKSVTGPPGMVGRRASGVTVRAKKSCENQCCSSDACNKYLCPQEEIVNGECHDKPAFDCETADEYFHVCDDIDKAKTICRKHCGLCDLVDGGWSDWSNWTICDVTCGNGTQMRSRKCDNPAPAHNGSDCAGDDIEHKECEQRICPLDGDWSFWSTWSGCSVTCGVGLQRRDRNCSDPFPDPDGQNCFGDSRDDRVCVEKACHEDVWKAWSEWSNCSTSCGVGQKTRERECSTKWSLLDKPCIGDMHETVLCNGENCTDSFWNPWSDWGECSVTCYVGLATRERTCNISTADDPCTGHTSEEKICHKAHCPGSDSAFLVSGIPLNGSKNGSIMLTLTITNVGLDYNRTTGQFICRIPGVYNFFVSIEKQMDVGEAYCHLMKNDNSTITIAVKSGIGNSHSYQQSSKSAVLKLDSGDAVYLGMCSRPSTISKDSTFSGYLVETDY